MNAAAAIPDGIAPISAYRLWLVLWTGGSVSLHALSCRGYVDCGWSRGWVTARCDIGADHAAPQEGCSCGFYALKLPAILGDGTYSIGEGVVLGRVELAGRVIEHDLGYRAERARIVELLAIEGQVGDVMRIANQLDIRIGPLLPRADELEPN